MSAIFGSQFDDDDLYHKVDGIALRAALFTQIEAIKQDQQTLSPAFAKRCRRLVILRFGFEHDSGWTLGQIGHDMGVSSERVRQIKVKLLRKLRWGKGCQYLKPFIKSAEKDDY